MRGKQSEEKKERERAKRGKNEKKREKSGNMSEFKNMRVKIAASK